MRRSNNPKILQLKRRTMGFCGWKATKTQEEMFKILIETKLARSEEDAPGVLEKLMGRRTPQASKKPISQELPYARDFLGSYSLLIEPNPNKDDGYILRKKNTDR